MWITLLITFDTGDLFVDKSSLNIFFSQITPLLHLDKLKTPFILEKHQCSNLFTRLIFKYICFFCVISSLVILIFLGFCNILL